MRKIKISVGAVTLGLALVAGPAAGVAQARTAPYPDLDLITLKTTGGFVGGVSYGTSYIKWNSAKGYTRSLWLEDGVKDGRCTAVYERATFTTGKSSPTRSSAQSVTVRALPSTATELRQRLFGH